VPERRVFYFFIPPPLPLGHCQLLYFIEIKIKILGFFNGRVEEVYCTIDIKQLLGVS